jgi:MFS family permease
MKGVVMTLTGSASGTSRPSPVSFAWRRTLDGYPGDTARLRYLVIVVLATIVLYYELYASSGVATLLLAKLHMSFLYLVTALAIGNLVGAFGSLAAGLTDRFGRANLVVYGLLVVGLLTLIAVPNATTGLEWAVLYGIVGFVEGIILVATPALIRDFSPQVGRATAMGFWTMGPVVGSLVVSVVASQTLTVYGSWQSQYVIAGAVGVAMFLVAFFGLRELSPRLRSQLMVNQRDRALIEARAKGLDVEESMRHPWRQVLHFDVIASAFGVSVMLLIYYTAVAFFTIYLVTIFGFSLPEANSLGNWNWAANAVALVVAGIVSDRLRVRKPFMLVGGIGAAVMLVVYLMQAGGHPSYWTLVVIVSLLSIFLGFAYTTWMASFTETVEARNPALTATGLAVWGWIIRIVITISFLVIPLIVNTVNTLVAAPTYLEQYQKVQQSGSTPSPALLHHLEEVKAAAAASPGQWQTWYWVCFGGIVAFLLLIFVMKGRWSTKAAREDEREHDRAVAAELAGMTGGDDH